MAYIAFWMLALVVSASALFVITARNPVHSVLWLILAFFTSAGLLVLIGAEFLAMLLVVVYVGAVAVLFLFVVMMLDVDFVELKKGTLSYWPLAVLVGAVFFAEIALVSLATGSGPVVTPDASPAAAGIADPTNIEAIGAVMYTKYALLFQLAGIILLVAMIGAIVLTLKEREGIKRQNIAQQTGRRRSQATEMKDPTPGQGI